VNVNRPGEREHFRAGPGVTEARIDEFGVLARDNEITDVGEHDTREHAVALHACDRRRVEVAETEGVIEETRMYSFTKTVPSSGCSMPLLSGRSIPRATAIRHKYFASITGIGGNGILVAEDDRPGLERVSPSRSGETLSKR